MYCEIGTPYLQTTIALGVIYHDASRNVLHVTPMELGLRASRLISDRG